ncbi:hypothetical protein [Sphingobium sp. CAP-1]|uniref:hypothetical protein n=1 Tax=Sphingobium sp. CAP-1 TaxID=2676077 RepID=UPI0012BB2337|nr:hypothetical protein [Sphingobium sp. CAP-1]QGP79114.1 hypothetical protein GL174_08970 [Sphingobium sp. CAP-1]
MASWHPSLTARIGVRLIGIALLLGLRPESVRLHRLVEQSTTITPAQALLAATCFISASLGAMLLVCGPNLWKPVSVARRWHGHAVDGRGHSR